jgi:hypothetical protein
MDIPFGSNAFGGGREIGDDRQDVVRLLAESPAGRTDGNEVLMALQLFRVFEAVRTSDPPWEFATFASSGDQHRLVSDLECDGDVLDQAVGERRIVRRRPLPPKRRVLDVDDAQRAVVVGADDSRVTLSASR